MTLVYPDWQVGLLSLSKSLSERMILYCRIECLKARNVKYFTVTFVVVNLISHLFTPEVEIWRLCA